MDLNSYRNRVNASDSMDAITGHTKLFINHTFPESPLFAQVMVEGVTLDARIGNDAKSNERQLLFRPDTSIYKGDIVQFQAENWLTLDFIADEIYPKADVRLCNQWLKWRNGNDILVSYPVVVLGKTFELEQDERFMLTPERDLVVLAQYNPSTTELRLQQRFLLEKQSYEIVGIDDLSEVHNEHGIIKIYLELTSLQTTDDVVEEVADNDKTDTGWGNW